MPICIGKATRLIEFLDDDKEYIATIQFGKNTSTYDVEGDVTDVFDTKVIHEKLLDVLNVFRGEIEQMPPMYSAIKVNGKKLYEYARKGENVEVSPRKVMIYKLELLKFNETEQTAQILVRCSKGTYIRSLAYDIGEKLHAGGYLTELVRSQAGKFLLENAIQLKNLEENFSPDLLINPLEMLDFPRLEVDAEGVKKIRNGQFLKNNGYKTGQFVILVYNKDMIAAIGVAEDDKIKMKKVFL